MEDLDALKSDPAVLKIYGQYVRGLKKVGNLYTGSCPLHQDSHPSFSVYPDGRWTCFSGADCGSGNIFQLIERVDKISFQEAVEKVKIEIGQPDTWKKDKERVESVFKPVSEKKVYKTIPLSRIASLEEALKNSPEAVHYLDTRGITLETAQQLRLGFVQNLGSLAGEEGKDIADKGWLAFNYLDGDLVRLIKYRSLVRKRPGGFARQFGMETVLYGIEDIDPFEPVYLVSGEFDRAVMKQAGFRAVSLASDTHKPTPEQKDQLMSASMVILAGDTDTVGSQTMDRLWKEFGNHSYKLTWPDGAKDANQCFLETCGRDQSKFKNLVEELTSKAKSQPMPSVYSVAEVLNSGQGGTLSERPDRLHFPWPLVDQMLVILPGHVFGTGSSNSGMGKTMWTVQASLHNAVKYGRTVLNFQAEMTPSEIGDMIACQMLRVDRNFLTDEDRKRAAKQLQDVNYFVGYDPNLTELGEVLDLLEAAIRRLSPEIVLFDHFHFFSTGADNETKVQSDAMSRIKRMAETYKVIFINVGQPRKSTQQNRGKRIHISDFKGSGAWGDNANSIIVLHRELNKEEESTTAKGPYADKTLVQVVKGRSLGTGASSGYLTCFGEFCSFEQIENNYEEPE